MCVTGRIFSVTGTIFHFALSQEIFFSVTQGELPVRRFVPPLAAMSIHSVYSGTTLARTPL